MQADMGGWTRNSLATGLPQPLLRWSSLWHSVIRPVVHHNIMLRNRVPFPDPTGSSCSLCLHGPCHMAHHRR